MNVNLEIYSFRKYGQPKLEKPSELKGLKQIGSANFNKHCKCPIFVLNDDVWIKHRDFFSETFEPTDSNDIGADLSTICKKYFNQEKKCVKDFVYSDTWGDVVLRNEAWLILKNGIKYQELLRERPMTHICYVESFAFDYAKALERVLKFEPLSLMCSDTERMFEAVERILKEYNENFKNY